jgi:hypothetical protein
MLKGARYKRFIKMQMGGSNFTDNKGERFMKMVASLDEIKITYARTVPLRAREVDYPPEKEGEFYLITHLKHWIDVKIEKDQNFLTRNGKQHAVMKSNGKDLRRSLPTTINSAMSVVDSGWDLKKRVTVTWIVCYLNKIHPDQEKKNWEYFECSHTCIEFGLDNKFNCISSGCLIWESQSVNQSRGNEYCMRKCSHCQNWCCHCQMFHDPKCN